MSTRTVFLAILFLSLLFYLFSSLYIAFFLLIGFSLLASFLFVSLLLLRRKRLSVSIKTDTAIPKEENIEVALHMKNKTWLPIVQGIYHLEIINELTKEKTTKDVYTTIPARKGATTYLNVSSIHCGKVTIFLQGFTVTDFLGLFTKRIEIEKKKSFYIVPNRYRKNITDQSTSVKELEGLENNILNLGESTEYIQLKPYEYGDSVKKIHWKLSSKLNEFVIKETSSPLISTYILFLETNYSKKLSPEEIDHLIETYVSYASIFITKRIPFEVAFCEDNLLQRYRVDSLEHLEALLPFLLQVSIKEGEKKSSIASLLNGGVNLLYVTASKELTSLEMEKCTVIVTGETQEKLAV